MDSTPKHGCEVAAWGTLVFTALAASAAAHAAPPVFSNQTATAGVTHVHSTSGFAAANYTGGSTVGDFNNDGFIDLFVFAGGNNNRPDRLYINNTDGTFTNEAKAWGVDAVHRGKSAIAGDFNNDGWLDLYVTSAGPVGAAGPGHHKLYRNDSNPSEGIYFFTNVAVQAGVNVTNPSAEDTWTACFGDYDLDGALDLFVGGFRTAPVTNNGNHLFRNNGDETFANVTQAIGLFNGVGPIACLACAFADMNGDSYPELLLIGDFKNVAGFVGSRYFRNNGPNAQGLVTFTDRTVASNTGHEENGMGHTLGDFQNDGLLDWYVTSIKLGTTWTGNKLYRNIGFHSFIEHAAAAGVADGHYGWGAAAADFNNDGWCDLAATNGDGGASGTFGNKPTQLWVNNGNPPAVTFTEVALASGISHFGNGRTFVSLDYNNDGRQDLLLTSYNEPLSLFRNDLDLSGGDADWLRIHLNTSKGASTGESLAPSGFGAKVEVKVGSVTRTRWITGTISYLGASELVAHFGLGSVPGGFVDEVRVIWPKGDDTILTNVAVNQILTLSPQSSPGKPCPADLTENGSVGVADLLALLSCWGSVSPGSGCEGADLTGDGSVGVADLLALLSAWGPCP